MLYMAIASLWFVSLIVSCIFGFYLRTIVSRIGRLQLEIRALAEQLAKRKSKEKEIAPSSFVDMEDAQSVIEWEHKEMLKKLNPEQYGDD